MKTNYQQSDPSRYLLSTSRLEGYSQRQKQLKRAVSQIAQIVEERKKSISGFHHLTNHDKPNIVIDDSEGSRISVSVRNELDFHSIQIKPTQQYFSIDQIKVRIKKDDRPDLSHHSQINNITFGSLQKTITNYDINYPNDKIQKPFAIIKEKNVTKTEQQEVQHHQSHISERQSFHQNHTEETPIAKQNSNHFQFNTASTHRGNYKQQNQKINLQNHRINYFENNEEKKLSNQQLVEFLTEKSKEKYQGKSITTQPKTEPRQYLKSSEKSPIKTDLKGLSISQDFKIKKNKILERLRNRQKQQNMNVRKKRNIQNIIYQKSRTISPKCRQITERLYNSRIKSPCGRHEQHNIMFERKKFQVKVREYGFGQNFFTSEQLNQIFFELKKYNIPDYKWSMKILQAVYRKNRYAKK